MLIRNFLSEQKGRYLKYLRQKKIVLLKEYFSDNSTSIISNNCLAGFIYQDLNLPYLSPTAGLYFFFPDYIDFISDLKNNLNGNLEFHSKSKYDIGNDRIQKHRIPYPVATLNGKMEIHFLHYKNATEAETKWRRRIERINLDKLLILGTELDLCTENDIKNFDSLDFNEKVFLTRFNYQLDSTLHIKEFETNQKIGDPYQNGHILYQYLAQRLNI